MTLVQAYERQYRDVAMHLQRMRDEQDLNRALDASHRTARQGELDARLARLRLRLTLLLSLIVALVTVLGLLLWRLWPLLWPRLALLGGS